MKRYTTFSIVFYSPITLYKPDKQTNTHKSSFNNKDKNNIATRKIV